VDGKWPLGKIQMYEKQNAIAVDRDGHAHLA
jgi:hypothetical protein